MPVNTVRFFADVVGTNGETAAASDLPLPNTVTVTRSGFVSLLWSFPFFNRYGGAQLTGSYAAVRVNGPFAKISKSGFGDPGIDFHANIFGAPALRLDQYPKTAPTTFSSFHITVNPPLGSYDRNSPVNTGGNRWSFAPVLNLSITRQRRAMDRFIRGGTFRYYQ